MLFPARSSCCCRTALISGQYFILGADIIDIRWIRGVIKCVMLCLRGGYAVITTTRTDRMHGWINDEPSFIQEVGLKRQHIIMIWCDSELIQTCKRPYVDMTAVTTVKLQCMREIMHSEIQHCESNHAIWRQHLS
jgi:hypothetical protein